MAKVIFLHLSVIHSVHRGGVPGLVPGGVPGLVQRGTWFGPGSVCQVQPPGTKYTLSTTHNSGYPGCLAPFGESNP